MKTSKAAIFKILFSLSIAAIVSGASSGHSWAKAVELVEKRTLNSRVFNNGDGNLTLEAHGGHIHYVDRARGVLEACDTTLIDTGDKWIQTKASYHCEIPKYADGEFFFVDVFKDKNQKLVMRPLTRHVLGEIDNSEGWGVNKRVLYRNAYGKGLHLRVTAGNVGLFKEIIIDKQPDPLRELSFDFEILPPYEHVYVQKPGDERVFTPALLANLTVSGGEEVLFGHGPISENEFSRIRRIRVWDSDGEAISGRIEFYRKDGKLCFRKIVPKEFLATAAYPVFTDDTVTYYAGTGDGYVQKRNSTNWDTTHNATSGSFDYTIDQSFMCRTGILANGNYVITRAFLPFDTSALPDDASITAATLELYVTGTANPDNDNYDFMVLVQTSQASPTALESGDLDTCGTIHSPTEGSNRVDIGTITVNQYNTWTLDATGRAWISTTGWTQLGMREGHDVLDHPFVGGLDQKNRINGYWADSTGTTYDPKLNITYSAGGAPTTHYVDPAGSNTSPYDTPAKAAHTIQAAVNVCSSGTVYVRKTASAYTYFNMKGNVDVIGTDESWNPSDAADFSDHPTIATSFTGEVEFYGPMSNAMLKGFVLTGGGVYGAVFFEGRPGPVTNVTLSHCQIPSAPSPGITMTGAAAPTIEYCEVINAGTSSGLGAGITTTGLMPITPSGSPITIKGTIVRGSFRGGIYIMGENPGGIKITIGGSGADANQIYDSGRGGILLYDLGSNCDVLIDNNEIYNNGTDGGNRYGGVHIENVSGGGASDGVVIQRNTIHDNNRGGIRFAQHITRILNNTVVGNGSATSNRGGGIIFDDPSGGLLADPPTGTAPETLVVRNNISAYNRRAGLRVGGEGYACPINDDYGDGGTYRDYNVLYANHPWNHVFERDNPEDCGWFDVGGVPYVTDMCCTQQQSEVAGRISKSAGQACSS